MILQLQRRLFYVSWMFSFVIMYIPKAWCIFKLCDTWESSICDMQTFCPLTVDPFLKLLFVKQKLFSTNNLSRNRLIHNDTQLLLALCNLARSACSSCSLVNCKILFTSAVTTLSWCLSVLFCLLRANEGAELVHETFKWMKSNNPNNQQLVGLFLR